MLTLDQFRGEEFQGYVENVPRQNEYLLSSFLPDKTVYDLKFAYNVINKAYARTASITGFNSDAPLRDKDGLAKHFGEVAKVQHGFKIDEEELLRFNRPRVPEERQEAIDYVYDQTDNLVQGVYDIEEWMRAQVLYHGRLEYKEHDVVIDVDYGIPSENKLTADTAWDAEGANPLSDIKALVKQFQKQNNNKKPVVIHMSSEKEGQLLMNDQIRLQVYGESTSQRLVTQEQLRAVFSALSLPPYQINDDVVDNGDGEKRLLPESRIVALGADLGKTFIGPTVEKNYQPGIYVLPIIEVKPPQQEVYVGETVFPALQRPKSVVWMDV